MKLFKDIAQLDIIGVNPTFQEVYVNGSAMAQEIEVTFCNIGSVTIDTLRLLINDGDQAVQPSDIVFVSISIASGASRTFKLFLGTNQRLSVSWTSSAPLSAAGSFGLWGIDHAERFGMVLNENLDGTTNPTVQYSPSFPQKLWIVMQQDNVPPVGTIALLVTTNTGTVVTLRDDQQLPAIGNLFENIVGLAYQTGDQQLVTLSVDGGSANIQVAIFAVPFDFIPPSQPDNVSGATTFLQLSDTPSSYSGNALDTLQVNAGETALEFTTPMSGATPTFQMTNRTGITLAQGDVVFVDTANDSSVITSATNQRDFPLIVAVGGADLATIECYGIKAKVNFDASTVRGQYAFSSTIVPNAFDTSPLLNGKTIGQVVEQIGAAGPADVVLPLII